MIQYSIFNEYFLLLKGVSNVHSNILNLTINLLSFTWNLYSFALNA